jgi:hypothetical protein
MFSTNHPAWLAYTAALARLLNASSRFEKAQAENCPRLFHAEHEIHKALEAYAAARYSLAASPARRCDGVRSLQAWLGPAILVSSTPHHKTNRQSEAG